MHDYNEYIRLFEANKRIVLDRLSEVFEQNFNVLPLDNSQSHIIFDSGSYVFHLSPETMTINTSSELIQKMDNKLRGLEEGFQYVLDKNFNIDDIYQI